MPGQPSPIPGPFGQQWMMSQRIEEVSPEEMARRAEKFFASG